MSNGAVTPLEWIYLQLIPLEAKDSSDPDTITVWWNPDKQQLFGEHSHVVEELIGYAIENGVNLNQGAMELTEPLGKPSQLAAILAQKYWVVPVPVEQPGDLPPESE